MPSARRIRLLVVLAAGLVVLGVPSALAQSLPDRQAQINDRIADLKHRIEAARAKEGVLSSEIEAAGSRISTLEGDIGGLSARIAVLERELAAHRARLERLRDLFAEQTQDLNHLKRQFELAERQLEDRLIELYQNEDVDSLTIILQVRSLSELLDQVEYFRAVGGQDRAIADELERLKREMRLAREKTRATKTKVGKATAVLADKTAEQIAARNALVAQQNALAAARASQQGMLADVRSDRQEAMENLDELEAASAALAARIQAAQSAPSGGSTGSGVSASGFIWPVNGVITSGFGPRWGRMHTGIDIAAPGGTPIRAAASGTVIIAGWMGGYGNLSVIDHGNGLATAYAHQSAIYVGGGHVSQGQVIGAVGSTGNSTGNHLHFEVRVNGTPVDPMGYL